MNKQKPIILFFHINNLLVVNKNLHLIYMNFKSFLLLLILLFFALLIMNYFCSVKNTKESFKDATREKKITNDINSLIQLLTNPRSSFAREKDADKRKTDIINSVNRVIESTRRRSEYLTTDANELINSLSIEDDFSKKYKNEAKNLTVDTSIGPVKIIEISKLFHDKNSLFNKAMEIIINNADKPYNEFRDTIHRKDGARDMINKELEIIKSSYKKLKQYVENFTSEKMNMNMTSKINEAISQVHNKVDENVNTIIDNRLKEHNELNHKTVEPQVQKQNKKKPTGERIKPTTETKNKR